MGGGDDTTPGDDGPADDGPIGAWQLDGSMLGRLRVEHLRGAARAGRWLEVELEAEELLDEEPAHAEALFLLGEASVALGRHDVARNAYAAVAAADPDGVVVSRASVATGQALAAFHTCDVQQAIELARDAVRLDPERALAHHVLSMALDFVPGRSGDALAARMAAARLAPEHFPLPERSPPIEVLITQALEATDAPVRAFYAKVPFEVAELPPLAELRAHTPPTSPAVLALTVGEPPDDPDAPPGLPERVLVFTRNLERVGSIDRRVQALAQELSDEAALWVDPDGDDGEDPGEFESDE